MPAPCAPSGTTSVRSASPASRSGFYKAEQAAAAPPPGEPYDLVFLDPPYVVTDADLCEILLTLRGQGWLAEQALVTVERSTRGGTFPWPDGFEAIKARRYGEGTLWYGRAASTSAESTSAAVS